MRRNGGQTTLRRLFLLVAVLGPTVLPSPAGAADYVGGFTWYSDGTYVKSVSAGTVITAYATQARPNAHFYLVAAPPSEQACPRSSSVRLNPNVRSANSTGVIAPTSGVVNLPPGDYQICFLEQLYVYGADSATAPVHLTVS